ncbi:MAG: glycosyltransferase family 4 protein [Desulfosalsimonadaceae bacterium]
MTPYRVLAITDRSDLPETELFIRLRQIGVDIEVACNPTGRFHTRLEKSGIVFYPLILKTRFSPSGMKKLREIFERKPYDIIYCFNNHATSNLILSRAEQNAKIVTYRGTVGNINFFSPASWTTHLNPRVKRIICVSRAVRDHLNDMRFMGLKFKPGRAVAIYKGHDLDWYRDKPADLSEFGISKNDFVVTFAGRDRPHKGAHVIVDAAKFLPPDMPVHFILMGKIAENKKLIGQIAENRQRHRIHLPGFRNDAPAVIAAGDVFVMPSTKREGLSRAVIEAMCYGIPPIVTNVGGLPELVTDNDTGYVIPPNDPQALARRIIDLYGDPATRKRLGENARARINEHFNINTTVAQTRQVFEELMADTA